jgi:hypothetical protein
MSTFWPNDCSGSWSGHYVHDTPSYADRSYPFHAELRQVGDRLEGEMMDEVTETALSLHKLAEAARDSMGKLESQRVATMLRHHPGTIVQSNLPAASSIRGRVREDLITFTKTYQGPALTRWKEAEIVLAASRRDRHSVHYSGTIDRTTNRIEGAWLIRRPGLFGRFSSPLCTGMFSLQKLN